jgi:hypothetical protein
MLLEPPSEEPIHNFDLSLLNKRIEEVKTATRAIPEQDYVATKLATEFFMNKVFPVLNVPQIHQMLQNPEFVKALGNLIGTGFQGAYILGKTSRRNLDPNE